MTSQVITGYYRYTDIWFEWHPALPHPDDRKYLKAILAHDTLVHPDHPLQKEGIDGIELFMGTLTNDESRLLFSSAQVDYVRYWLHAMQLTKTMIPLPYSNCLLTDANLKTVSPVVYKDGGSVRGALKKIDKNNKRLKGANPTLNSRRDTFERVRTFWSNKKGVWCAVDFEAWDRDHTLLIEFGWSLVRWDNGVQIEEKGHLVVEERQGYSQTYVAENRKNYDFGQTKIVKKVTFKPEILNLFSRLPQYGPVYLVFHDNSQDIKYLKSLEVPLDGLTAQLPNATPSKGLYLIDTSDLFAALEGDGSANRRSLDRMCKHLQIPTEHLHNAGNDAEYTLRAMKSMASGDPLDSQREKRWPNKTGNTSARGVKVEFQPWEEDSDYSDQEGLFESLAGYDTTTGELRTTQ